MTALEIAITWYIALFFILLFVVIGTRFIIILKLYSIKGQRLFDESIAAEVMSFLMSMTLPFRIDKITGNIEFNRRVKLLNKLKNIYWGLMISLVIFIVLINVLQHGYHIEIDL